LVVSLPGDSSSRLRAFFIQTLHLLFQDRVGYIGIW
jgi:hypothetical protein